MKKFFIYRSLIITFLIFATIASYSSNREKARYYFLQGSLEASQKNMPEAYEYFKKAYEIDPSYLDASFLYGNHRLFLLNDSLQTDKELKRSIRMLSGYVDAHPQDMYATQLYGYITTALDTIEEAIRVYETTYQIMPEETGLLQMLADAYMRSMKPEKAYNALERFEAIEGKSKDTSLKKISIKLNSKDTLGAIKEIEDLISTNPRDAYSYIMKGNLYEVIGEMDSVYKSYKQAEIFAPDNGAVKMSLAQYYQETGDSIMLDNMVYEALLSEDFELEEKLVILGEYLQKLLDNKGDRTRGDHLFSVLQSQYPHEPDVLDMAARYAGAKGELKEAIETLNYAIDMEPTNEKFWIMLLTFDLSDGAYSQAVKDYERAKEYIVPSMTLKRLYSSAASMLEDTVLAENILNNLLTETDERLSSAEGREAVRKSIDYEGLQWVAALYCSLGDLNYKAGKPAKAFENYELSLYFYPDNTLTLNNYAYFLSEENKDLEKAKTMSRKVIEKVEKNPTYLDTYAWILYKLGDYKEAMKYMELAIDLAKDQDDDNEEYQLHYKAIKEALEKWEQNDKEEKNEN